MTKHAASSLKIGVQGAPGRQLTDLNLPEDITKDPFAEQPLRLIKTEAGWLIYSVGRDGVDDGGSIGEFKDYGIGLVEVEVDPRIPGNVPSIAPAEAEL